MAPKARVFLDTNVVLDHLADRQPFAEHAHRLFALAEIGELELCVSSLSFSNLYYILRKLNGRVDALTLLRKLKDLVTVCSVADTDVESALASSFNDFEDALQHFAAKRATIAVILTRNKSDFNQSDCTVQSPDEFLALFENNKGDHSEANDK